MPFMLQSQTKNPSFSGGLLGAQVVQVLELVNYQTNAIANREVVKTTTGSVTILAFDEGQSLKEHTAPFDALVQMLEGEAEISIAGIPQRLHGGEMILVPAREPHALKAISRFKMILTKFRSEARDNQPLNTTR